MSTIASEAPAISGPSAERYAFLKRTAMWTLGGLVLAGVVGCLSTLFVAPFLHGTTRYMGGIVVLVTFMFAHWICRKMVYSDTFKIPGFLLAVVCEGVALGWLILATVYQYGGHRGAGLIVEALSITAATSLGMLVYAWFSKGELKLVGAFLSMTFFPMIIVMILQVFFPIGGFVGLIVGAAFVVVSAAGLLYKLNYAVSSMNTDRHVEAAYEITMGVLVLLWNIIQLLRRLR
jgi:FtsH-binding integral membrane protein